MITRTGKLLVLLFAVLLPGLSQASEKALADFLAHLRSLQSMDAGFEQSTRDNTGKVLQQMTGTLTVAKPGKMRWHTNAPFEQLVVADGQLVWIYDMDLEQVSIRELDQRVQETPALLLTGDAGEVEKSFIVTEQQTGNGQVFQLVPKDHSQLFDSLEFHYRSGQLSRMVIFDAAGQVTDISFTGVRINQPVDEEAFIFNVPEGVDVIDGRHDR